MLKSNEYSIANSARAARAVREIRGHYPSLRAIGASIALKVGFGPRFPLAWAQRVHVDAGVRDTVTTVEAQHSWALTSVSGVLRLACEILKPLSTCREP